MAASGFSGLGLQMVWTQQATAWLGHEAAAMYGVVTAFFGGLALGALACGPIIRRSARPLAWYTACEAVIALWSLLLLPAMPPAAGLLLAATGSSPSAAWQWTVAFGGTLLLLLPATAAMGATLPALERALSAPGRSGAAVAVLYAANTAGAVAGVLAAVFWLVPALGLAATAAVCSLLNLLCACTAWWALRGGVAAAPAPSAGAPGRARLGWTLAATGCLGIGFEVLVVRALRQVAENTVYTFAILLAVYLLGTALGAAWLHRRAVARPAVLQDRLLLALALAALLGSASLWALLPLRDALQAGLGTGVAAALAGEAALAVIAFAPATLVMGALFALLAQQATEAGLGLGRAIGVNTLGAALAAPLAGVLLVPLLGAKGALLSIVAGYLLLLSWRALRAPPAWLLAGAVFGVALWAPPLVNVDLLPGARLASHREGALGTVSVIEDTRGVLSLHIDNRQQEGSSDTAWADGRQAVLPLLLHPAPQRALLLGLGTGVTAAAAAGDPALTIDVAELLPEVAEASRLFGPQEAGAPAARYRVQVADARRFVRAGGEPYDLIVADNFHPARSGSAALYTVEHFAAVKARLAPGGLFCQWLPLHQLDLATLRVIVRSFIEVHPQGFAVLATHSLDTPVVGLVGGGSGRRLQLGEVRRRLGSPVQALAAAHGLGDAEALLGSVVATPGTLTRWAAGAPLNTDDRPLVAYLAPTLAYTPLSSPRERLLAWLAELQPGTVGDVLDPGADTSAVARLDAYRQARGQYLQAGRNVRPSADVQAMLAQVRQPLLDVLRTSPQFRPAYEPLLQMAAALGRSDPAAARALLLELERLQPAWPDARAALAALPPSR